MKIALIGFGLEAKSAYDFLSKKFARAEFEIYDQNEKSKIEAPSGVKLFLGAQDLSQIEADLVVRTPAVNPRKLPQNTKITSVTNLFFENCPAKIIGVTGSKGKGTTSSFIAEILRASGKKTHLVGNIGLPALDVLARISPNDAVVYEMSSFQLWDLERAPQIAVLTNIEPDHLDVHDGFEDYVSAKMNIATKQKANDFFIYNQQNEEVMRAVAARKSQIVSKIQTFAADDLAKFDEKNFYWQDEAVLPINTLKLAGEHNRMNALAAMTATFDFLKDEFSLKEIIEFWRVGLSKFEGLPHRLKFVREVEGVKFYDDSIATTPGSAIVALKSFGEPKLLILGGNDKGADLSPLIEMIAKSGENDLRKVILIGAESEKLEQKLRASGFERFINLGLKTNMAEIVKVAFENSKAGDTVILSPAHASFDMFKSYSDRGEQFIENVNKL